jgi:hypothetical protein
VENYAIGGCAVDEISEVTIEEVDKRLKVLEKAVLKLTLQNENLERESKRTALIMDLHTPLGVESPNSRSFEPWKPKLSPVKDEDGNTD